ncbi:EpsG family protein [Adlercreutzia sp. ZJ141]|uniref:EpsG family protein n=1 Tax=Adlercreutzia sp. ZJ141 TaxID=2709406 RepID=UPI0013EDCCE6|nr:EpsG family protein [Adlercreutzia sp. ZJ141]
MLPYLSTFMLATVLFEVGKSAESLRRGRLIAVLAYVLALFSLCFLAGVRDLNIGTDTGGYGAFLYQQGLVADSFASYLYVVDNSYWDVAPLYALYSYVVVKLFGTQFAYFFAVELAVVLPVFLVSRRICARHLGVPMLLYMLILYIPSFNMMRQSVALGFVLLAVLKVMDGKLVQAALLELVAALIHSSALIGVVFCLLWCFLFRRDEKTNEWGNKKWSQILIFSSLVVIVVGILFFREIAGFLSGAAGIGRLFAYGTHNGSEFGTSSFVYVVLLVTGALLMIKAVDWRWRVHAVFFSYLVALCIPFYILSGIDNTIGRMMEYCALFIIPYVGIYFSKSHAHDLSFGFLLVVGACMFRFFFCFVWQGFSAAVPYTSTFLGIL